LIIAKIGVLVNSKSRNCIGGKYFTEIKGCACYFCQNLLYYRGKILFEQGDIVMHVARERSCCFTGYRPEKLPWRGNEHDPRANKLKWKIFDIVEAVYQAGISHYICGMARGADFYFCEAALSLREEHPEITIEAAIPFAKQAKLWSIEEQRRYFHLVSQCDYETVLGENYAEGCMRRRNQYMVDNAALLIAVFDGKPGGTMQTIKYAKSQGLEIVEISP